MLVIGVAKVVAAGDVPNLKPVGQKYD